VIRRLQFAYERHGVGSDLFNGLLHEYLRFLNATWYQDSHGALSEHREDLVTNLYIKMIDPANNSSGASIYAFKGVRDGQLVPVHRFVNSVFKTFFAEKERKQRDYDFKHFRLVDDGASSSPVGDVRVGQLDKLVLSPPEEEKQQNAFADLKVFGLKGQQFANDFEKRSDVHFLVIALLRQNADMSAIDIVRRMKTTRFAVASGDGEPLKVIDPMEVHERKVQRIKAAFFDGLRDICEENVREKEQQKKAALEKAGMAYTVADTSDPEVLAQKVYGSMMARVGKRVRRHPVETKKSRTEAQTADPNYVEKTFSKDGVRFGGSRKRTNMDSDVDKDAGSNIS
jgi:hypothetical protein